MRIKKNIKYFYPYCLLILVISPALLYAQSKWVKIFDYSWWDETKACTQTYNGNIVISGITSSVRPSNLFLLVITETGDVLLEKIYSEPVLHDVSSIAIFGHDSYLVSGINHSNYFPAVVKTDLQGNVIWERSYFDNTTTNFYDLESTRDDGFIIAGSMYPQILYRRDALLVKADYSGEPLWTKIYESTGSFYEAFSISETADEGYIIVGDLGEHAWIKKTDKQGIILWQNEYGGLYSKAHSVIITEDNGYVFCGEKFMNPEYGYDVFIVKVDSAGITTWEKTFDFGGTEWTYSVIQTSDMGYALAGTRYKYFSSEITYRDILLIKTDQYGNMEWYQRYGDDSYGSFDESATSVFQTSDEGFLIAGSIQQPSNGRMSILVIKTDKNGNTEGIPTYIKTDDQSHSSNLQLFQNFPNPFNAQTTIKFSLNNTANVSLIIYDLSGKEVLRLLDHKNLSSGDHAIKWIATGNSSGVYFSKLISDREILIKKILLVK